MFNYPEITDEVKCGPCVCGGRLIPVKTQNLNLTEIEVECKSDLPSDFRDSFRSSLS